MRVRKVSISVLLSVSIIFSLFVFSIQLVKAQTSEGININSDGSISTTDNSTAPIQRLGNLYTFSGNVSGYSVVIQRNNIIVDGAGFSIQGSGDVGVGLSSRVNVTVRNLKIYGSYSFGMYLLNSKNNVIVGNEIRNDNSGMAIESSANNIISANNITGCVNGIVSLGSSSNKLSNNKMNNLYNLGVYGTELAHFINDFDNSNTVNGRLVYYLLNQSNVLINPSTFSNVGYLALVNCANVTAQNLELTANGQGVLFAFTTNSKIASSKITQNLNSVWLRSSSNIEIVENEISDSDVGINLDASSKNSIFSNKIMTNNNGILLTGSSQNTIIGNNITSNRRNGMGFSESSGNLIYTNYFVGNTNQVHDAHMEDSSVPYSINDWNTAYPTGGNYWSDYKGVDVKSGPNQDQPGSDGIGDKPYLVYSNNQDNYPLMPYGSPPAIYVVSPVSRTYTENQIPLTIVLSEQAKRIGYSLDGKAEVTITGNTTLTGLSYGTHTLTVYATDNDGMTGTSETIHFTVEQPQSSESIPILLIAGGAAVVCLVAVALGLIIYTRRRKNSKKQNPPE